MNIMNTDSPMFNETSKGAKHFVEWRQIKHYGHGLANLQ